MEKIISEKLRAVLQRKYSAPRDYYNLWYMITNTDKINWNKVTSAFKKKCAFKNVSFNCVKDFFTSSKLSSSKQEWEHSLNYHMKTLPCFDLVVAELKEQINKVKLFLEQ